MKVLSVLSKEELLKRTQSLVAEERRLALELIDHLREVERRMLFAEMGYASMWEFCLKFLGLTENEAQTRLSAMRLSREVPEVKRSLEEGTLTLTNAARVQSFLQSEKKLGKKHTIEEKRDIIKQVEGLSKLECERKLYSISPQAVPKERERVVSEQETELRILLSSELLGKLKSIKSHLAHKIPGASYADLIQYMADQVLAHLERKRYGKSAEQPASEGRSLSPLDGMPEPSMEIGEIGAKEEQNTEKNVEQAKANLASEAIIETETRGSGEKTALWPALVGERKYIPVHLRRQIWNRAEGMCEYVSSDGRRCSSKHGLELDHVVPVALGGSNELENIRCLCRSHNVHVAVKSFGLRKMSEYVPSLRDSGVGS